MSIGTWFKQLFSSPARTDAAPDVAADTHDERTIDDARLASGGSGPLGFPTVDSHASSAEGIAESESTADE